jgi:hypothetical protein
MSETQFEVTQKNPNYNTTGININCIDPYVFLSHAYEGTGGFSDGTYLVPFVREGFYENRKAMANYRNYVKPIINSTVSPLFNKSIIRESDNDIFNEFLTNVDNAHTNINSNANDVLTYARLHGVTFVVMDNFSEIPITRQESINTRKFPFIYIQPAYLVSAYELDDYGNLISITFKVDTIYNNKKAYKYTTWNNTSKIIYIKDGRGKVITSERFDHNLNVIPVISVYSTNSSDILPRPPFYDVAKTNYTIYNKDSEIRDQERSQAFSILYYQTNSNNNNITVGPNNCLILPASNDITITPGFVQPDSSILTMLVNNTEKIIDSLYKLAEAEGIIGVQKANSGIAASYKFTAISSQLNYSVNIIERYEHELASIFGKYINEEIEYNVKYSTKWEPSIDTSFQTLKDIISLNISDAVNKEIKKLIISDTFEHLSREELDNLLLTLS